MTALSDTRWSSATITGTLRVHVVPGRPLSHDEADQLRGVLESFLAASSLGLLPGQLQGVHDLVLHDAGTLDARVDVTGLHLGSLRVLHGMLLHYSVAIAPLRRRMAWCEPAGHTPNLFDADSRPPELRGQLPFDFAFTYDGTAVPRLIVTVKLGRALTDEEMVRFEQELRVWASLVNGGYPERDQLPGTSSIGALTVRVDEARAVRMTVEAFAAGTESLQPLETLVRRWSETAPMVGVEEERQGFP